MSPYKSIPVSYGTQTEPPSPSASMEPSNTTAHELALNPDVFTGRSDQLILSTLVHLCT